MRSQTGLKIGVVSEACIKRIVEGITLVMNLFLHLIINFRKRPEHQMLQFLRTA
jgi:hypothetical protein